MKTTNILESGKEVISLEIEELKRLYNRLDESFIKAITLILNSKGKVVITGVGKSAHIANKIVATLNSTGTPAQFMHAAEAIHGDFGMIKDEDIIICISNSGTSPEIQGIVPLLKDYSSALIAITGNKNSLLAKSADIVLDSNITKEACPHNLAPTTSTTVQIALGDAIAISLMNARNFVPENFARNHPGGALGKNLLWKVEQLVKKDSKPKVDNDDSIKEVITSLSYASYGITVVTENNKIVGVITDGDLRRMMVNFDDIKMLKAYDIMSKNPKKIQKDELAINALNILKKNSIGQLIVMDGDDYFGIIDIHSLLEEGFK